MILPRILPSLALLLSGCAGGQASYPSLARRPIESAPVAQPAPPTPVAAPDPALDAQVAKLAGQAQAGQSAFDARYAAADKLAGAASGAAVSSEAWVAAQQAISALESARNESVSALASLDTLYVERNDLIADGKVQGGAETIDGARAAALAMVDDQNDRIDGLKGRLAQP